MAAAAVEVNRINQNATVVASGCRHDAQALGEVLAIGPRHGLEVDANAVRTREIAKCCEIFGQSHLVGIVTGDQGFASTETRACLERRFVVCDAGVGFEPENFNIETLDTGVLQPPLSFANQRRIADHCVLHLFDRSRNQPKTDAIESRSGSARNHIRRREFEHGQRRETNLMSHGETLLALPAAALRAAEGMFASALADWSMLKASGSGRPSPADNRRHFLGYRRRCRRSPRLCFTARN